MPPKRKLAKKARLMPKEKSKKQQKPFPFLSLPPELRDQIYELALTDEAITLVSKTKKNRRTVTRGPIPNDDGTWYYGSRRRRRARRAALLSQQSQQSEVQDQPNQLTPALLAVNKQVHSEALGYLYQQPIVVEDTYALHSFLASIGSNRSAVTEIVVRGWGGGRGAHKAMNFCAFPLLGLCNNLKKVVFDCEIGWYRAPERLARQLYRDGHIFFEAYGTANGGKDAAVDVLELSEWNFDKNNNWSYRRGGDSLPDKDGCKKRFQAELRKLLGC